MRATADNLRRLTGAIVKAGGSAAVEADLVAEHLVRANLLSHDSHGVGMIPTYVRHLKAGLVVPNTRALGRDPRRGGSGRDVARRSRGAGRLIRVALE